MEDIRFSFFHFTKKPLSHDSQSETFLNCSKIQREVSNKMMMGFDENFKDRNIGVSVLKESNLRSLFNLRFFSRSEEIPHVKYEGCHLSLSKKDDGFFEVYFCPTETGYVSLTHNNKKAKVTWEKIQKTEAPVFSLRETESCFKVTDFSGRSILLWVYEDMAVVEEILKRDEKDTHLIKKQAISEIMDFNEGGGGDYERYKENIKTLSNIKNISEEEVERLIWGFTSSFTKGVVYH